MPDILTIRDQQSSASEELWIASIYLDWADFLYASNQKTQAFQFYEKVIVIYEDFRDELIEKNGISAGMESPYTTNLVLLHQALGRYSEAEAILREDLEYEQRILVNATGYSVEDLLEVVKNFRLNISVDNNQQPLVDSSQSFAVFRADSIANQFIRFSALYQAQGDIPRAIANLQTGLELHDSILDIKFANYSDFQRQNYTEGYLSGIIDQAVSLSLQNTSDSEIASKLALNTVLRQKGRILDAGIGISQILSHSENIQPVDRQIISLLNELRNEASTLKFNPPSNLSTRDLQEKISRLNSEVFYLEGILARRSYLLQGIIDSAHALTTDDLKTNIPNDGVLIEYVKYHPFRPTEPPFNIFKPARYAAYLLFPDGRIETVDLGDAREIEDATKAFIQLLQDRNTNSRAGARPVRRPENTRAVTNRIKTLVFDPVKPFLDSSDHLLISPDGQLNLLPFEALQDEPGENFLVEQYQISYLNSGRDLLRLNNNVDPSSQPAVIIASPNYENAGLPDGNIRSGAPSGVQTLSRDLGNIQVEPLPGTALEGEAISRLLPNANLLTEGEATEGALKTVQAPRILHIATHGFFLGNIKSSTDSISSVVFTPPEALSSFQRLAENPLLRSGLALAGFNTRSSGSEDGVLTALEVSQLNLFGTQLVVLSACDTGLGDIANGEGVYGLRRAFAIAGAETQLLSLWQVSDFGTQSLMTRYYENLTAGMGRSEALREVQLEMIAEGGQYSHPYYWAAFILAGDWRSLD